MKNLMTTELKSEDVMLTACIWCANLDFTGLADYAIKAIIGGAIWLGFRLIADHVSRKSRDRKNNQDDEQ